MGEGATDKSYEGLYNLLLFIYVDYLFAIVWVIFILFNSNLKIWPTVGATYPPPPTHTHTRTFHFRFRRP